MKKKEKVKNDQYFQIFFFFLLKPRIKKFIFSTMKKQGENILFIYNLQLQ